MQHRLFSRETSCLVVIDVQQYFLDKLPPIGASRLLKESPG
jgi:nicotinamidase-related amidase